MMPKLKSDPGAAQTHLRMRRAATGLLLVMACVAFASAVLPVMHVIQDSAWLGVLRAGAKAGLIGGIADWFAVTALFRHPLGLPIPHTAILVKQQARLADATGRFVASQFFDEDEVKHALAGSDLSTHLAHWLEDGKTRQSFAAAMQRLLPSLLNKVEDGSAAGVIRRGVEMFVTGQASTPILIKILRGLVRDDLHKEVIAFLLTRLKHAIKDKEETLREFIQRRVSEQGGRVIGWVIGPSVAQKVVTSLYAELDGIDPSDPQMREAISDWFRHEISSLENDAERRENFEARLLHLMRHDSILAWSGQIWHRIRRQVDEDSRSQDGVIARLADTTLLHVSRLLREDKAFALRFDQYVIGCAIQVLPTMRHQLSRFISAVMKKWDGATLTQRLEERIGKDLQYIRINGTVVGFAIGAGLEILSLILKTRVI